MIVVVRVGILPPHENPAIAPGCSGMGKVVCVCKSGTVIQSSSETTETLTSVIELTT